MTRTKTGIKQHVLSESGKILRKIINKKKVLHSCFVFSLTHDFLHNIQKRSSMFILLLANTIFTDLKTLHIVSSKKFLSISSSPH